MRKSNKFKKNAVKIEPQNRERAQGGSGRIQLFIPWDLYYVIKYHAGQKYGIRSAHSHFPGLPNMSGFIAEVLGQYFGIANYPAEQRAVMAQQAKFEYMNRTMPAMQPRV